MDVALDFPRFTKDFRAPLAGVLTPLADSVDFDTDADDPDTHPATHAAHSTRAIANLRMSPLTHVVCNF